MNDRAFLSFEVASNEDGMKLSSILRSRFGLSRGMIRRLKRADCAKVEGETAYMRRQMKAGERVVLYLPPSSKGHVEPQPLPLDIRHEDDHLLVVEKPPGMLVHPAGYEQRDTLANGVVFHQIAKGELPGAGPVTRLDRGTSGLVLFAKHPHAHHLLTQAIKRGEVEREYLALVHGQLALDRGTVDAPIRRIGPTTSERIVAVDGQRAITYYQVVARYRSVGALERGATLVQLTLGTGRTHQIRVHMAHLGHPLIGDPLYGQAEADLIGRSALHARRLSLVHPLDDHSLDLVSQPPQDFQSLLERLRPARVD